MSLGASGSALAMFEEVMMRVPSIGVLLCAQILVGCSETPDETYYEEEAEEENLPTATGQIVDGGDINDVSNPKIQPEDDALAGGGRNQSQNASDVLTGDSGPDVLIGNIGRDLLIGNEGDDFLVGGTEDFNPENRDFALGGPGDDTFAWAPGDGSDFFDGGEGYGDVVVFGILGEQGAGAPVFEVQTDENADGVFINPDNGLPIADVRNSPGFCTVLDASSPGYSQADFDELGLTHLVQFTIRTIADEFEVSGGDDNGLRVTLHLKNVEFLVCTSRDGGEIEVLDLTTSPPTPAALEDLPAYLDDQVLR